jgi:hypothetical protein
LVRRGATIGANATVVCGITLGEYCFVGAGAVVTKDVKAFALMVGVPARHVGWVCRCGEVLEQETREGRRETGELTDRQTGDESSEIRVATTESSVGDKQSPRNTGGRKSTGLGESGSLFRCPACGALYRRLNGELKPESES